MEELEDFTFENKKRPAFLTVLGVLSFITIGWTYLQAFISLATGPMNEEQFVEYKVQLTKSINEARDVGMDGVAQIMEKVIVMTEATNANHYLMVVSNLFIATIGLLAVIQMFKGKKIGFHLYIIYSLIAMFQLYIFVSPTDVPTFIIIINAIISGLFIFMYSRNLSWMK